jgi:hypothetical protein
MSAGELSLIVSKPGKVQGLQRARRTSSAMDRRLLSAGHAASVHVVLR